MSYNLNIAVVVLSLIVGAYIFLSNNKPLGEEAALDRQISKIVSKSEDGQYSTEIKAHMQKRGLSKTLEDIARTVSVPQSMPNGSTLTYVKANGNHLYHRYEYEPGNTFDEATAKRQLIYVLCKTSMTKTILEAGANYHYQYSYSQNKQADILITYGDCQ